MRKKSKDQISEEALDQYIEAASNEDYGPEKRYATFYNIITKATIAEMQGELMASVNLYLAAYDIAKSMDEETISNALLGLQNAWKTAVGLKNRPACEQIFEIFSQYMSEEELKSYSEDLHDVMLSKLKSLGFPVDDLKNEIDFDKLIKDAKPVKPKNKETYVVSNEQLKYKNLVGYDSAIEQMRNLGLGTQKQTDYMKLVQRLNAEHGLDRIAFADSYIFKSVSRVDSKIFMEATAGEIGLPCIHMKMEDSFGGAGILTMMAPMNSNFRLNPSRTGFNGKGILILEDIDTWEFPDIDTNNIDSMMAAQISHGVAEVLNLVQEAIDDSNILVMGTVGEDFDNKQLLKGIIENYRVINVDFPNEYERRAIWQVLANDHPSLRAFNINKLVEYSKNMSRYSIEIAAHEALEDAYKQGLDKREFVPLTIVNIIEKLSLHQPLESKEYKNLEDVAAANFKKDIDNIDDLLK